MDNSTVTDGAKGVCVYPGEMGAILGAGGPGPPGGGKGRQCVWIQGEMGPSREPGDPAHQEGEKAGSWHQTVEEYRHSGMCQDSGGGLVTTPNHVYVQSECRCAL